jgi:DNA-directed RNA polymerase subunit RPC12/RpoP
MVVYDVLTFLQTMAFVCSTCGKAYSTNQNLARHSETHQDPKACHSGEVFSTSEGLKEHKRVKHEFRYSCTECPKPVIFASKSGLLGHTRKYHSSVFKVENVYNKMFPYFIMIVPVLQELLTFSWNLLCVGGIS